MEEEPALATAHEDGERRGSLRVTELVAGYGQVTVVHGASFSVGSGELVGITGSNGAGKTTLLKAIAGIEVHSRGTILLGTQRLDDLPAYRRVSRGLALVPEGRQIIGTISVSANLDLALMSRGRLRPDAEHRLRRDRVLTMFPRLAERLDAPGRVLSGGEQQMLAIGRALMCDPKVLLLDEPSQGLAPALVQVVVAAIAELKGGISIVLVEQHRDVLNALADRVLTLKLGSLSI